MYARALVIAAILLLGANVGSAADRTQTCDELLNLREPEISTQRAAVLSCAEECLEKLKEPAPEDPFWEMCSKQRLKGKEQPPRPGWVPL